MTEGAEQNNDNKTKEIKTEDTKKEDSVKPAGEDSSKKNSPFQPRRTETITPTECASCGKRLLKKLWYYRNNAYYCSKTCFHKKTDELKEKSLEEQKKNNEEKEKEVGAEKS